MWDLDGVIKLSDLSLTYKDLDFIRNVFMCELKENEKFSRFTLLNIPYEITTSEDIYKATGLYKIIYSENSVGKYRKDNFVLVGNRNMLDVYSPVFIILKNVSYQIEDIEIDGIKLKQNFLTFSQVYNLYTEKKLILNDYDLDFNTLYNFYYKIKEYELLKVLMLFKMYNLKAKLPLIFEYELKDFTIRDLSYFSLLAEYCDINIIISDANKNTHLSTDFKCLLNTYSNIKLLNVNDLNPVELIYVGPSFESFMDKSLIKDLETRINVLLNWSK